MPTRLRAAPLCATLAFAASLCFAWPSSLAASTPPPGSAIFKDPATAAMAENLAKGDANAAMLGIARGASPNAVGLAGIRPIHYVVSYAHDQSLASLRALVNAGADPNAKMDDGSTPLGLAAKRPTPDAINILLGARARPADPSQGKLPIQIAMESGARASFEILAISGSPLSGPSFATGGAAQDLARSGRHGWLLWMANRGLLGSASLPESFWADLCSGRSPDSAAAAKILSAQPRALGCPR